MVVPRGEGARADDAAALEAVTAELYCPFQTEKNPEAAVAQQQSLDWALELGLVEPGPSLKRLERARFAELEANAFPGAPIELLTLATEWVTLFCALDDFVETSGLGVLGLSGYLSSALVAFRGSTHGHVEPLLQAFQDVGSRMRRLLGDAVALEFAVELEGIFSAFVWEEINRQNAAHPDFAVYRIMRMTTVGVRPHFLLSQTMAPSARPSNRDAEVLQELERITCRAVGWANDIFTYEKELSSGEVHNIVSVLMRTERLPLREALERARALHDEEVCSFLRLQARLAGGAREDGVTEHRVAHLRHWIGGHLQWARQNGRYRPGNAAA
jgi:5-epi-alpha-selinene synthase